MTNYIDYKEIELDDKPLFDYYIGQNMYENSEFNFTNFFIWRYIDQLKFAVVDDYLCISGRYRKKYPFIFPPLGHSNTNLGNTLLKMIDDCKNRKLPVIIKGITDPILETIEKDIPGVLRYKPDINNYDYIYLSNDIICLPGRKYQKKRNHINKFKKTYDYVYEQIDSDNIEECIIAELEWVSRRRKNRSIQDEKTAIIDALRNFDYLGLKGGALRVNSRIIAFSLGELLNPEMAVIHIEKANIDYNGSYAMINQQFAEKCWSDTLYINREEDMGLPGLRKAKKSYYPVKMIKKYTGLLAQK